MTRIYRYFYILFFFFVVFANDITSSKENAITRAIRLVGPAVASINVKQHNTSVSFDIDNNEIFIFTDAGRIIRPVLYLKTNKDNEKYNEFIQGNYLSLENWNKCVHGYIYNINKDISVYENKYYREELIKIKTENDNYMEFLEVNAAPIEYIDSIETEKVLKEKYGFKTTILTDASYSETADAIIKFTKNRKKTDNLLIYYAGHGELEKDENRGYWLPVDAGKTQDSKWLGNDNIKNWIRSSKAKHILLIVDSCFSGTLMRGSNSDKSFLKHTKKSIDRLKNKTTRIVMTSGGNEPVVDSDGGNHSYFADKLLKVLKSKTDVFVSLELFQPVRQYVIENALGQTPEHSSIHGTGHDGGEFLFFPNS